jgi:tRNA (guanosine-2'-O-)-methyltransferase
MKRISVNSDDVFRPKGQLSKEIELAGSIPHEIESILGKRLSDDRRKRIEDVVRHRTNRLTVAIEGVRDPHNTAAIIRTSDAFGLQVVHIIERGNRFLSSRRVTQGAHKWVDLGVWKQPKQFVKSVRKDGKKILCAAADGGVALNEIDPLQPMALVFGNEHEGISPEMRALADGSFRIPMSGFVESLNVSVAAAITIAELRKDRRGDLPPDELAVLRARYYLRAVRAGYDIVMMKRKKGGI